MSPEAAKVFIAEDEEIWRQLHREALERYGHEVVIEVGRFEEGLTAIPRAKELGTNIALIDGRIPNDPPHGVQLAKTLRDVIPDIKVVDVSGFGDAIPGADAKMAKANFNADRLGNIVTEL